MFRLVLLKKDTYDSLREELKIATEQLSHAKTEVTKAQEEWDELSKNLDMKVESSIKNHDKVVSRCETSEARFSLFRRVVSAIEKIDELYDFRSFLNSQIERKRKKVKNSQGEKDNLAHNQGDMVS